MQDVTSTAQDLYGHGEMLDRIIAVLKSNGADPEHPSCEDLHACDQMHARGIEATREHAAYANITPGMHVLEIGCGIGGASRYLAEAMGCRVSAIDITPECIDVARELTRRADSAPWSNFVRRTRPSCHLATRSSITCGRTT